MLRLEDNSHPGIPVEGKESPTGADIWRWLEEGAVIKLTPSLSGSVMRKWFGFLMHQCFINFLEVGHG